MTARFDHYTLRDLHCLRTDPAFQRTLLLISLENQSLLQHAIDHGHVPPDYLERVRNLICEEREMANNIVRFLGGRVTVTLFEFAELPVACLHLRQTVTVTTGESPVTHPAPLRPQ